MSDVERRFHETWLGMDEQDQKHMQRRLEAIEAEIEGEPGQIEELYRTVLRRLEPVGMVYLWPETRG